ncbi:HAMP domain-containing sensor histidine kinase [Amycolatopsis sp. PS_44_ISF1]|uniref:sensor histidine kinase n=1 Tax=Amycolatopsis sp. PS_44_ISF1 TaxID=2974917 RepID=UPI0028DE8C2C|nr:HAMP domain-containing sensor histidine kinase [Amycolatopsis sp. PS_44_ISF1]MDT8916151.1 HAMP domain-containing histidine kinase [Amycolatopsis sp. PS_44_ISF1]
MRDRWPLPTRARSALVAGLACAFVFTFGGLAARHFVEVRTMEQSRFLTTQALIQFFFTRFEGTRYDGPNAPDAPVAQTSLDGRTFEVVLDSGRVAIRSHDLATYYPGRPPLPPVPAGARVPSRTVSFGPGVVSGPSNSLEDRTFEVQGMSIRLPVEVVNPPGRSGYFFFTGLRTPLAVPQQPEYVNATVYLFVEPYYTERALGGVDGALWIGIPLSVLFVAAAAWVVAGRALRPVAAIRAEMAEIGEHALQRRVPVPAARDEIAELAATTNATLDRLQSAMRQQQRFVADASHELRSPLAALRTGLDSARSHPDQADWPSVTGRALADVGRLQALVTDLLLLAEQEGKPQVPLGLVDLTALAEEQTAERRYLVEDREIRCQAEAEALVRGDPAPLERVLRNLLDNAVRHAGSTVVVSVTSTAETVVLEVADDGPGVAAADRERVFDRFTRLDDARARDAGGTGLGLAIARMITRRHGGTLRVADSAVGARFVATFPRAEDPGH